MGSYCFHFSFKPLTPCLTIMTENASYSSLFGKRTSGLILMSNCCPSTQSVATLSTCNIPSSQSSRRSANYQPTSWNTDFIMSLGNNSNPTPEEKTLRKDQERTQSMEKEMEFIRHQIEDETKETLSLLELIDDVQRLGLTYRFENNIKRALNRIISMENEGPKDSNGTIEDSLHMTALYFRLLRQHGFEISTDVFNSFLDQAGSFKAEIEEDIKGMMSLYEASYYALERESVLEKAKLFIPNKLSRNIKRGITTCNMDEGHVSHCLEYPWQHRMERLEARWHIEEFSKSKEVFDNQRLLHLAKLDFNTIQYIHQRELQEISSWWGDMGLASTLNFARDRLMENFFWSVGIVYEPCFSKCRKVLAKVASLITVLDDIYDVYGSLDELQLFTNAVQRWDIKALRNLPDYMQLSFLALYNTVNAFAYDIIKEKGVDTIPYLTKAWTDLCLAFLQEAKWSHEKSTPTFQEYFNNAWVSVSGALQLVHAYPFVTQNITKDGLKSLEDYHDLLRWSSIIFRLYNDLSTSEAEIGRGETANAISCYMNETGCSEDVARQHLRELIDETWKKMNYTLTSHMPFKKSYVEIAFNLSRIAKCHYKYGDGHSAPDARAKNAVISVIIEPIKLVKN